MRAATPGVAEARKRAESAQRMKTIRRVLGLTQRDYAYFLRVAVNTVSEWENGKRLPSQLADRAIREVLVEHGVDPNTLRSFGS